MGGLFDSAEVELPCENCGRTTKKSIGWIKNNSQFTCACGTVIALDASEVRRELAALERSIGKI